MKSGSPSRTTAAHKTQTKIQAWSSLLFHCCHSSFNPSEAPPWDSRPVSGAGVVHYQLLHRPRSVPMALGPAPLVTSPLAGRGVLPRLRSTPPPPLSRGEPVRAAAAYLESIEFVVMCLALFGLCCLLRSNHAVPLFVMNLFLCDIIQICVKPVLNFCTLTEQNNLFLFVFHVYIMSIIVNIGFMVCISVERYIMIKYPVWYRLHHSCRNLVLICL